MATADISPGKANASTKPDRWPVLIDGAAAGSRWQRHIPGSRLDHALIEPIEPAKLGSSGLPKKRGRHCLVIRAGVVHAAPNTVAHQGQTCASRDRRSGCRLPTVARELHRLDVEVEVEELAGEEASETDVGAGNGKR
jgi:hypothetical protein